MEREEQFLIGILHGDMPHAIVIAGPEGSGKAALARRGAALFCLGEDAPERLAACPNYAELAGADIGVAQVRALMSLTAVQAFNGGRRAFVITDAHRIAPQSQNALLKTLEEPPADTLMLLTGNEAGLLPTVRSRCMTYRMGAGSVEAVAEALVATGVAQDTARICAQAADGVAGLAQSFATESGMAFRRDGTELLRQALFGVTPFAAAETLMLEETAREGKRRRVDGKKLKKLLSLWESLARDALLRRCGAALPLRNPDGLSVSAMIAQRFTDGQIRGIIDLLGTAQLRLAARGGPGLLLDTLLARLSVAADE